eukprot:TRINITY_DN1597_c0_g1_i1.p2 TRINITY_DN1597_c0_g1~~TRINITY_DN1597_c0_g1_i1.p2  ORF type:complete len:156 (-),score=70.85 TRINITY_DN1597_c0_g1_i1:57-524(-)
MVVKTEVCYFTEFKIFPGHGSKFVRKDGKLLSFVDHKASAYYHQKLKAANLRWTQIWRRNHKKSKVELVQKRKAKRSVRLQKAVVGMSAADILKKKSQKPEVRQAAREAALREVKERNRKVKEEKKKSAAKSATKAAPSKSSAKAPAQKKGKARA